MNCTEARQRWHLRLDNGDEDAELNRHLAACEKCRTYAARMDRLVGLMDDVREDTDALVPSSRPEIARNAGHGWSPVTTRSFLRIAAVIVIAVAAGLWYRMERHPTVLSPPASIAEPFTAGITLRAESHDRFIAVAAPSADPNVQTYWIYPSVPVAESQNRS